MSDTRCGVTLDPKDVLRAGQNALQRGFNPRFKGTAAASGLEETHQALEVCVRYGLTVSAASQRRQNLSCALPLRGGVRRTAAENATAARRIAGTRRIKRPVDCQCLNMWLSGPIEVIDRTSKVTL